MASALIAWLVRRRRFVLPGALALAAILAVFAGRLRIDNSLDVWFVDDDPTLVSYRSFLDQFGNDEVVVTTIHGNALVFDVNRPASSDHPDHSGRLGDVDRLARLHKLTAQLATIDGVARVRSLANIPVVDRASGAPIVTPIITPPVEADDVRRARDAVAADGLAAVCVGRDHRTLAIFTWMVAGPEIETERGRILDDIRSAVEASVSGTTETVSHGGLGVVYDALNRSTLGEGAVFILLSYGVMFIVLFLITRRLTWVLLALAGVTCADVGLLGVMAILDRPINMITMALPALVMILGVANAVHMTTDLDIALARGERTASQLRQRLADITTPCFFNAVTTAVAFLSLTTASMAVTRDYGLFAAIGVVFAFGFVLVAMSALLPRVASFRPPGRLKTGMASGVARVMRFSLHRRAAVVGSAAVVVALSVWGASRITVDTYSIDFLPRDHVARSHSAAIEHTLGPYVPLELTLRPGDGPPWQRAAFLQAVARAQVAVEMDPAIGRTTSILDMLREAHIAVTGDTIAPRPWAPPSDDAAVRLASVVETWGGNTGWIARDEPVLRVTATTPMASVRTFRDVGDRVVQAARDAAGGDDAAGASPIVTASGYLPLYGQMIEHILGDQLRSFGLAFLMVFVVVSLILRSWRFTLAAIPPNLVPVLLMMGVMGLAGIRLDIATVTIAAVVLGVIVDDTVHILYRLKRELAAGRSLEVAMSEVARASGVAVVSTSIVFCAGFTVVALAGTYSVANVGLLTAVAVAAALVTDLLLLPAFVSFLFGGVHDD